MLITNLTAGTIVFFEYILEPAPGTVTVADAEYDSESALADRINAMVAEGSVSQSGYAGSFPRQTRPDIVPGASRILGPFPFAFDDAGLNDGIVFYTPTVGDILLDAWIETTEAWDGTTPNADIGTLTYDAGLYNTTSAYTIGNADNDGGNGGIVQQSGNENMSSLLSDNNPYWGGATVADVRYNMFRVVPARFSEATPMKIVVSQDGLSGGAAVGGTTGAGAVYLVIATPSLI